MNTITALFQYKPLHKVLSYSFIFSSLLALQGCGSSNSSSSDDAVPYDEEVKTFNVQVGSDLNNKQNSLLSQNSTGPGGASNQSLRSGDVLQGDDSDDLLIGGLGVDILIGGAGDDILIGGTEDFNANVDGDDKVADNRDRAFGQAGDDLFVWAPGDGSDFFDGGEGTDVIVFGVLGEQRDADGSTEGAPFFNVNPAGDGSQDFDGIFLDTYNQPQVRVSNTPGFCSFIGSETNAQELDLLNVDQVVRFTIRDIANAFDAAEKEDDDGLRVAVTLKNTEFVVCTQRDFDAENGLENIEVFDISSGIPVSTNLSELPSYVQNMIQ